MASRAAHWPQELPEHSPYAAPQASRKRKQTLALAARTKDPTAKRPRILTFMNRSSLSGFRLGPPGFAPFPVGMTSPITTLEGDGHAASKRKRISQVGGFPEFFLF